MNEEEDGLPQQDPGLSGGPRLDRETGRQPVENPSPHFTSLAPSISPRPRLTRQERLLADLSRVAPPTVQRVSTPSPSPVPQFDVPINIQPFEPFSSPSRGNRRGLGNSEASPPARTRNQSTSRNEIISAVQDNERDSIAPQVQLQSENQEERKRTRSNRRVSTQPPPLVPPRTYRGTREMDPQAPTTRIAIYCDGACRNNGTAHAKASAAAFVFYLRQ